MLAALTPTLSRAGSGTGEGALFSIVFGRAQLSSFRYFPGFGHRDCVRISCFEFRVLFFLQSFRISIFEFRIFLTVLLRPMEQESLSSVVERVCELIPYREARAGGRCT